jgi:ABC-type antimicrobial peptide transport system permease subunit
VNTLRQDLRYALRTSARHGMFTAVAAFGSVAILLGLTALVAAYLPVRRRSRVDPVIALRSA